MQPQIHYTQENIDYLVHVTKMPADLQAALNQPEHRLFDTACVYQRLIDSQLLWKVWQIDEYGKVWLEVNFIADQQAEFHSIALDKGTYDTVEFEPYPISFTHIHK